jgi:hypothetical protein
MPRKMSSEPDLNTFVQLYEFLREYNGNIRIWLGKHWVGKDKQEALLRIFAVLGLILNDWAPCGGNFNTGTIEPYTKYEDFFYTSSRSPRKVKDSGDKSDLTCLHNKKDKHLLLTTSKNKGEYNVGKLDIADIEAIFSKMYNGYTRTFCFCVRDKNTFAKAVKNSQKTSEFYQHIISEKDTIIIDWNDLETAFWNFKRVYSTIHIDELLGRNRKNPLVLKFHQKLSVYKISNLIIDGVKNILLGQVPRSGKTYIDAGSIILNSEGLDSCNYLIITTAPKETIDQFLDAMNCLQLQDFKVLYLNGESSKTKPKLSNKNIIICSKQFLQRKVDGKKSKKVNTIKWLKDLHFDMRFVDEAHHGGSTELARKVLELYGKNTPTVFMSGTPHKPTVSYQIPSEHQVLWDLEDINMCKRMTDEDVRRKFIVKHGDYVVELYKEHSPADIEDEYKKYPELHVLTRKLTGKTIEELVSEDKDGSYGYSTKGCFLLNSQAVTKEEHIEDEDHIDTFQNINANLRLWYMIFGKRDKRGRPDPEYPDDVVIMNRIQNICRARKSRFMDTMDTIDGVPIIMAFLPHVGNICAVSKATKKLLKNYLKTIM